MVALTAALLEIKKVALMASCLVALKVECLDSGMADKRVERTVYQRVVAKGLG